MTCAELPPFRSYSCCTALAKSSASRGMRLQYSATKSTVSCFHWGWSRRTICTISSTAYMSSSTLVKRESNGPNSLPLSVVAMTQQTFLQLAYQPLSMHNILSFDSIAFSRFSTMFVGSP